ncbi:Inner-membrane translocator [Brucella melitensis NI]|nr:Inner-membrane translocator [Brucella melitensis NI]EPZ75779.1 hypothetical protein M798_09900 [Brucella melitensis ADMAS-G1]EXU83110.1 hypothetical protein AX23_08355 [Brucella melitensis 548]
MLFPPARRPLELPRPYAALVTAGVCFIALVIAIGNGPPFLNHPLIEVGFTKKAPGQNPVIPVAPAAFAANRRPADPGSQLIASFAAAIIGSVRALAALPDFRCVDPFQANMGLAEHDCIPVNDIGAAAWLISVGLVGWQMENQHAENEKKK